MASKTFGFNSQSTYQNYIDVADIGNCCIECLNDLGFFTYIIVKTSMGTTTIVISGPASPDMALLPDGFNTSLTRLEYNETKIIKFILATLNNKKLKITNAEEVDFDTAIKNIVDIGKYLSEGGY